jgi:hypothetical protein
MIDPADPAQERAFLIHFARVMLADARYRIRSRPTHRAWAASQLASAARARREAAQIDTTPQQRDLFA